MLSSLFMAAFAAQVADDGFSKLQIFLQQLIDWGVSAGGRIIGAVIIFVVGLVPPLKFSEVFLEL